VDDGTTIGSEYLFYPGAGTSVGVFSIDSCSARNYKGALRFANGTYRNIQINNSIFRSLGNYGFITYPLVNATTATITVSNSTFYSIDQSILYLKNATNTAVNISNCTFDNILNTTANFYYLNNTTGHSLSISSSIFGKTNSPTTASGVFGTPSPYTVTGCISATDWGTTAATAITGLTAYPGASTALFKSPSTFNSTTVTSSVVGDYTLLDNTVGSVGDPRWRKVITGLKTIKNNIFAYFADQNLIVNNVEVGSVISVYSFNGSLLNKQIANSNKVTVPVNSACIVKITSNKESVCLKMIK